MIKMTFFAALMAFGIMSQADIALAAENKSGSSRYDDDRTNAEPTTRENRHSTGRASRYDDDVDSVPPLPPKSESNRTPPNRNDENRGSGRTSENSPKGENRPKGESQRSKGEDDSYEDTRPSVKAVSVPANRAVEDDEEQEVVENNDSGELDYTASYYACLEAAGESAARMTKCNEPELQIWERKLRTNLRQVTSMYNTAAAKAALDAGQKAWENFRDLNCKFYGHLADGADGKMFASDCYLEATMNRVGELQWFMEE